MTTKLPSDSTKNPHPGEQRALPGSQSIPGEEQLIGGGKTMSIFDHLTELRSRLVKALTAVLVLFCIGYAFSDKLIGFLKQPLINALPPGANSLHFTGPMDVFIINMKVAALAAVIAACPVWLYQFWKFFEPALYPRERRYILPFIIVSALLFFAGVTFCYYLILPMSLDFFIGMGLEVGTPIITVTDYISLLTLLILGFGLVFETPVIIVLMALLDLISVEALTQNRRVIIIIILIIAAVLTPPDPISQVALATPVYLMYEIAIIVIRLIKGREKKAE